MTLYRQMFLFILLLLALLLGAAFTIALQATRSYLEEQLSAHAQDTATSLGLSLQPHIALGDMATAEAMINAVFDRGYYRRIVLADLDGSELLERHQEVVIDAVPGWFTALVPLAAPEATTMITSGWQRFGTLAVSSHPGYLYKSLWRGATAVTLLFALIAGLFLLAGAVGLRLLLKPLAEVERQAEDLCQRRWRLQTSLPATRELRRVVVAMNSMTEKVRQMFSEQAELAEAMRREAYSDPVTGLGNRRYLEAQVAAAMEETAGAPHGALLLLFLPGLAERNREKGFVHGDRLLQETASLLDETVGKAPRPALARISGATFAILLPDTTREEAGRIASAITGRLSELADEYFTAGEARGHIGGAVYDRATPLAQLLATADRMLASAASREDGAWEFAASGDESAWLPRGDQQWRQALDHVLDRRAIAIFGQKVMAMPHRDRHLHTEILARMVMDDGETLSAALFIPLAERLRRVAAIDRLVLENCLQQPPALLAATPLAINLSTTSLDDEGFVSWLLALLAARNRDAAPLIFEFSEVKAAASLSAVEEFARGVRRLGHNIALDHFGQSFASFACLRSLEPCHVKIDRAFVNELKAADGSARFFIGALVAAAHSLDIPVIAEGVEDEGQEAILRELHVDGLQGFLIDTPQRLTPDAEEPSSPARG